MKSIRWITVVLACLWAVQAVADTPPPPRGSVADRIRATSFAAAVRPPLSDEDLVKRVEAINAFYAQSVIDTLCIMAAEVEFGMLEMDGATRGVGRGTGNILADEPDKNIYARTLKAAKLAWSLRKEAEKRGGSCDAAHGAESRSVRIMR